MCANRCLVWGMTSEQKNVDAWDMERRTESTVPLVAIVHMERWEKRTRARRKQEHDEKRGIRWRQV